MAKEKDKAPDGETEEGGDGEQQAAKQGFVKKLLGNRKLLIIAAAALAVVLGGGGAGAWFFLFHAKPDAAKTKLAAAQADAPIVPPKVAFFDMPDVVVNIQSPDGSPAYLKLSVALELKSGAEEAGLKVLVPRIVDQFQGYLRELRVGDLQGSESVMRIKEELLRRIKVAAEPYPVRDVLLKEMIVQ
ncbi:MAG: flagellar basal body-associated FliL family protein [Alphaproteobacteria bacterium]|nr:flagellar basal body-associated FliL family protein [Alphaproteobacteria bacterium]MDE2013315.1 flagellar basal body-associated FliL family protein [Alphaproteobacteria bacterium]MDE2072251.1 flagellar basal body-associated FliL family protein [Alphaproteobacteria bacterium]MDE2350656.1 flagellar basal body-associated FliL family protein [Alphaproteobacteria bacterium]